MPDFRLLAALLFPTALLCQQLGLRDYLRRLESAPGLTIEQKVENLSRAGVTLSPAGLAELERLAGRPAGSSTERRGWRSGYQSRTIRDPFDSTLPGFPTPGDVPAEISPALPPSYTARPHGLGGFRIENDLNPFDSYTARPRALGGYRIESDRNPLDTYTVRPRALGGFRIENDRDPFDTYTARPRPFGGYRIESDRNPFDTYTVRPRPFGGYRIENDRNPFDSFTLRPTPFGGYRIDRDP